MNQPAKGPSTANVPLGTYQAVEIHGRPYVNATAMCKAAGKRWNNYWRNQTTQDYLAALAAKMQIRADLLVLKQTTGPNEERGTWVHRRVALHLARWCSAEFAVWVSGRLEELLLKGHTSSAGGA
jgi:hypothetical protein